MERFEVGREYRFFGRCTSRTESAVSFGSFGTFRIGTTEDGCEYINHSDSEWAIYSCFADERERE